MLEMDTLIELLYGLDLVVGEAEPGEQFELLEAVHELDVVVGQVENL